MMPPLFPLMSRSASIGWSAAGAVAALLSGCATDRYAKAEAEFPDVRANCRLRGIILERVEKDSKLLRLVFRQRHNARLQAGRDGSLACVEHWAVKRGYRITTAPAGGGS